MVWCYAVWPKSKQKTKHFWLKTMDYYSKAFHQIPYHNLPQSKAAETTWRQWATCSCTSCAAASPGRGSRQTHSRNDTRRLATPSDPRPSRSCARTIQVCEGGRVWRVEGVTGGLCGVCVCEGGRVCGCVCVCALMLYVCIFQGQLLEQINTHCVCVYVTPYPPCSHSHRGDGNVPSKCALARLL